VVNLAFARPSPGRAICGLVPAIPEELDWFVAAGIVATTFSIVGALFQAYLVRSRGWREEDYRKGVLDSVSGIGMLTLISMMIMVTAAAVLQPRGIVVRSAGDMALQLETAFGPFARIIFCVGLAAATFSSFIVNAMIGGTLLSDGLGLGDSLDARPARIFTAAGMLIGMGIGLAVVQWEAIDFVHALVAAQAGTLIAIPLTLLATVVVFFKPERAGVKPLRVPAKAFVVLGISVLVWMSACSFTTTVGKIKDMFVGNTARPSRSTTYAGRTAATTEIHGEGGRADPGGDIDE
jgi:Mn2+/Fe2+ NRAMP family transporter